jgi:hypothetical protein
MADVEDLAYSFDTVVDVVRNVLDINLSEWDARELARKALLDVCPDVFGQDEYAGGCEIA